MNFRKDYNNDNNTLTKTNHISDEVGCKCCQNCLSNHYVKIEAFPPKLLNAPQLDNDRIIMT